MGISISSEGVLTCSLSLINLGSSYRIGTTAEGVKSLAGELSIIFKLKKII